MAPRNHKNWSATPKVEYISSECYNNYEIFEEEIKNILNNDLDKLWMMNKLFS